MSQPQGQTVSVGDELRIGETNYRYGRGTLTMRVTAVGRVVRLEDGPWVNLTGTALRHRFQESHEVTVEVRMSALGASRRDAEQYRQQLGLLPADLPPQDAAER